MTNDLDFGSILVTRGATSPSVIQVRSDDLRPSVIGDVVLRAIEASVTELRQGAIVTIDPVRFRRRILDLGESNT